MLVRKLWGGGGGHADTFPCCTCWICNNRQNQQSEHKDWCNTMAAFRKYQQKQRRAVMQYSLSACNDAAVYELGLHRKPQVRLFWRMLSVRNLFDRPVNQTRRLSIISKCITGTYPSLKTGLTSAITSLCSISFDIFFNYRCWSFCLCVYISISDQFISADLITGEVNLCRASAQRKKLSKFIVGPLE